MKILAVVLGVLTLCVPSLVAQTAYVIDSDGTNHLWSVELSTGEAADLGAVNYSQIEGLATSPAGVLYGVDDVTDTLVTINPGTATATAVGSGDGNLGADVEDVGLTFDGAGNLWLTAEGGDDFYSVNPATGVATLINGSLSANVTGLAACGTTIYGVDPGTPALVTIDPVTGTLTVVGPLGLAAFDDGGLAMGTDGALRLVIDNATESILYTLDRTTGSATAGPAIADGGTDVLSIEGFTTASAPAVTCNAVVALPAEVPALDPRGLALLTLFIGALGMIVLRFRGL